MNKKITSSALAALMIAGTTSFSAFAAMANGTVVIGDKAFDLAYANDAKNLAEITNAIVAGGAVYVKDFSGKWINNATGTAVDASVIPAVTYKNAAGVETKFDAKDMDAVSVPSVVSVSALNNNQAVVTFATEMGDVEAVNFTSDNGLSVIKAAVSATNKKEVKLTFNQTFDDNETYKITVLGVKSLGGVELTTESAVSFKYEVSEISKITLDKTSFNSKTGEVSILDSITIKDELGRDITTEVTDDEDRYDVTVATTDSAIVTTAGIIALNADGSAYVEIKILDRNDDNKVLATTGAVLVKAATYEAVSLEGIHIDEDALSVAAYKDVKEDEEVVTSVQKSSTGLVLNLYAKDSEGDIIRVDATDDAKITNLNPTIANVAVEGDEFIITPVSTGTAKVKIKVGSFETTVTFTVKADAKVTTGAFDKTSLTLTADTDYDISNTGKVKLTLKDQYDEKMSMEEDSTFVVTTSKSGVATVEEPVLVSGKTGEYTLDVTAIANGTTTVTVKYKNDKGTVIFTKTFTVTVKEFGTSAKYDLVVADGSADYLDADDDTTQTGIKAKDNEVVFTLYQVDAAGNKLRVIDLDGATNYLSLDLGALTDAEEDLVAHADGILDTNILTFAEDNVAQTLSKSGNIKVTAKVGGVSTDSIIVSYKNTDAVAIKALVKTTNTVIDLDSVNKVEQILFGKYSSGKYTLSPMLTIQDQFGAIMKYNVANTAVATDEVDGLANGLTVEPALSYTNLSNVEVDAAGVVTLKEGKSSGSFTIVIAEINTTGKVNKDLLAAPVAITVNVVK